MIKKPNWEPRAVPTLRGCEYNGELLLARKHTQQQLNEYFLSQQKYEPSDLEEDDIDDYSDEFDVEQIKTMKKAELLELLETNGLDVRRYESKKSILERLHKYFQR